MMSKQTSVYKRVKHTQQEIEENVIRVLGHRQQNIITITNKDNFRDYVAACIGTGIIAIDTETDNSLDPLTCKLMGLCLYSPGLPAAYIPINHRDPISLNRLELQVNEINVKEELQKVLDAGTKILMHNGKFDYEVIKCTCDIGVVPHWDTLIAARLLNENERSGLKEQFVSKIDPTQEKYSIDKLFENVQYADVKPEIFALYSATDSYMTYKLYEYQLEQMKNESGIFNLFTKIEMPLVPIVADMELCGALADLDYCQKLKDKYEAKLKSIDDKLDNELCKIQKIIDRWKTTGSGLDKERIFPPKNQLRSMSIETLESKYPLFDPIKGIRYRSGKTFASQLKQPINLSSHKQLAILLYKVLDAPKEKSSKGSPMGTGKHDIENILKTTKEKLKKKQGDDDNKPLTQTTIIKYESVAVICELLSERRRVEKLITTYLNPVPSLANHWQDGKIRFKYNQLGTDTGRFTSGGKWKFYDNESPIVLPGLNGQNLPSENHEIRLMFKAEHGRAFVGGDISQQEPKITAHISLDKNMCQVFREGKDIYASIAQSIYKNNYEDNLEYKDKDGKKELFLEGKERRKTGKVIILATMYGMGYKTIAEKLDIEDNKAQEMLDAFYSQFPGLKKSQDWTINYGKKHGFVEDIMGRKRRLPNIQLPPYQVKFIGEPTREDREAERILTSYLMGKDNLSQKELKDLRNQYRGNKIVIISNEEDIKKAERQSFNARIQGSAATLTKMIMIMVARNNKIKKLGGRIVFQIHDELILDCPTENAEEVSQELKTIIERSNGAVGVSLPMKCDLVTETRWGEDTMTEEIKEFYQKLIKKNEKQPLDKLCEEFCNL